MKEFLSWLSRHTSLESLTFSPDFGTPDLPDDPNELANLKELSLGELELETFPEEISKFGELRSFSMEYADYDVREIIAVLSKLPELRELHLSPYCYDSWSDFDLPESISELSKLEVLDMAGSIGLRSLPETIGELKNLRILDLCNYDHQLGNEAALKVLPDALCDLIHLEEFDIFGCEKIKELPQGFERLSALRHLDISNTGIRRLSLSEEQIGNLEYLWMQGCLPDLSKATRLKDFAWTRIKDSGGAESGTEENLAKALPFAPAIERLQLMDGKYDDIDFIFDMPSVKYVYLFCHVHRMPERKKLRERNIKVIKKRR